MGDFDPAIAVAVALAVEEETDVPRRKRAKCSREWFMQRSKFGHTKLIRELSQTEPSDFKNFLRMDVESYNELLQMVEPLIEKQTTNMRQPIFLCDSWFYTNLSFFFYIFSCVVLVLFLEFFNQDSVSCIFFFFLSVAVVIALYFSLGW